MSIFDQRYSSEYAPSRQQSDLIRKEMEEHVAAFLAKGGKIQQLPSGASTITYVPFRISTEAQKADRQKWKEGNG